MMLLRSTAKRRPTRFALTRNGDITLAGDLEVAVTTLLASIKPYFDLFPLFIDSYRHPPN